MHKRVLNLYAGIGGNRALWEDVTVTAVEHTPEIAETYQSRFPDDTVLCEDAHAYLLVHYAEFDVIWSSPPCQSHSRLNYLREDPIFPDMTLYQEILFLSQWYYGDWVVENVVPYYSPLLPPTVKLGRHVFWASSLVRWKAFPGGGEITRSCITRLRRYHNISDETTLVGSGLDKRQQLRNCVHQDIGAYVLNEVTTSVQLELLEA